MKKVLLKDIVIPAGTVFYSAPRKREYADDCFVETAIGLTKNTYGNFAYEVSGELGEWFAELRE